MNRELLLATRNPKKKLELQQILSDIDVKVVTLDEVMDLPEVEEDGHTFIENAIKKAVSTAMASGRVCLADDSGLVVDALGGQPGIYSARFAGENADDEQNNEKLLRLMKDIRKEDRTARFVCVIAISDMQGRVKTVEGRCEGTIALTPSGQGGFGYDPLFTPRGYSLSFAEISSEEKNHISHRGQALAKARSLIAEYFADTSD